MLPDNVRRTIARKVLLLKKDSPHIFFVAGVAGVVVSTVMACKATLKLSETLDDIQGSIDDVNESRDYKSRDESYSENEYYADKGFIYAKGAVSLAKLYGPSVLVGAASVAALTGSHVQMTRRNASIMAAYAVVEQAYENYRKRVRAELGEERELDLHRGLSSEIVLADDGTRSEVQVLDTNGLSHYARFFDECSTAWEKDPELNRLFVQCQQNYCNHLLNARGHLFLNEVYDMLGLERSKAGAVVGWIANGTGDNYVDFNIFDAGSSRFVNNLERSILLDFNVDGIIYDKI